MIARDAGIDLMNQDSRIAEHVIAHFTAKDVPVLTIHDSFIVPMGMEMELHQEMQRAYAAVMKEASVKIKKETERPMMAFRRKGPQLFPGITVSGLRLLRTWPEHPDFVEQVNARYRARMNPPRSPRYQRELRRFREQQEKQNAQAG